MDFSVVIILGMNNESSKMLKFQQMENIFET